MKVKYFPKIYFVCVILILVVSMLVLVSCDDKKTNEKAVEPATAWEEIQEGFDKTAGASGYEVEFNQHRADAAEGCEGLGRRC